MVFEKIRSKLTSAKGDMPSKLGRNDPCHCGSGKKYKKCHLSLDEEAERKQLAKTEIPKLDPETKKPGDKTPHNKPSQTRHPTSHSAKGGGGFMRSIFNRKTGAS